MAEKKKEEIPSSAVDKPDAVGNNTVGGEKPKPTGEKDVTNQDWPPPDHIVLVRDNSGLRTPDRVRVDPKYVTTTWFDRAGNIVPEAGYPGLPPGAVRGESTLSPEGLARMQADAAAGKAAANARAEERAARRNAIFARASQTGQPVELRRWADVATDEEGAVTAIEYAMPDGTTKVERNAAY